MKTSLIKALAASGAVLMASSVLAAPAAPVISSPQARTFISQTDPIYIASSTPDVSLHYTFNGQSPSCSSSFVWDNTKNTVLYASRTLSVIACDSYGNASNKTVTTFWIKLPANFSIDTPSGEYLPNSTVTMSNNISDADLFYTLNGTQPSRYSTKLPASGEITLPDTEGTYKLRVVAYKKGSFDNEYLESDEKTANYIVKRPSAPIIGPLGGTYEVVTDSIYMSYPGSHSNVVIRYTSNGTEPHCGLTNTWRNGDVLYASRTLRAVACVNGVASNVTNATFWATPPAAPTISPGGGTYNVMTDSIYMSYPGSHPNATIRYTSNGTEPHCGLTSTWRNGDVLYASRTLRAVTCINGVASNVTNATFWVNSLEGKSFVFSHSYSTAKIDVDNGTETLNGAHVMLGHFKFLANGTAQYEVLDYAHSDEKSGNSKSIPTDKSHPNYLEDRALMSKLRLGISGTGTANDDNEMSARVNGFERVDEYYVRCDKNNNNCTTATVDWPNGVSHLTPIKECDDSIYNCNDYFKETKLRCNLLRHNDLDDKSNPKAHFFATDEMYRKCLRTNYTRAVRGGSEFLTKEQYDAVKDAVTPLTATWDDPQSCKPGKVNFPTNDGQIPAVKSGIADYRIVEGSTEDPRKIEFTFYNGLTPYKWLWELKGAPYDKYDMYEFTNEFVHYNNVDKLNYKHQRGFAFLSEDIENLSVTLATKNGNTGEKDNEFSYFDNTTYESFYTNKIRQGNSTDQYRITYGTSSREFLNFYAKYYGIKMDTFGANADVIGYLTPCGKYESELTTASSRLNYCSMSLTTNLSGQFNPFGLDTFLLEHSGHIYDSTNDSGDSKLNPYCYDELETIGGHKRLYLGASPTNNRYQRFVYIEFSYDDIGNPIMITGSMHPLL